MSDSGRPMHATPLVILSMIWRDTPMMEMIKGGIFSHLIAIALYIASTTRLCCCFSFPALLLHTRERYNNVVQHVHPSWLDVESRLLFILEEICPVEFSDYRFLPISGGQLHIVVQHSASRIPMWRTDLPWDRSFPLYPTPICIGRRLVR